MYLLFFFLIGFGFSFIKSITSSIAIAKFKFSPSAVNVFTPINSLFLLNRGPPELPGLMLLVFE